MLKSSLIKAKYYWHLFRQHYNELLIKDCLSEELKKELKVKALYHHSKAIELVYKINIAVE